MAEKKTRAAAKGEAPSSEKLEELLSKAESCVEEIGKEGQSLEDAFSNYEEGIRLIRQCSRIYSRNAAGSPERAKRNDRAGNRPQG
jgi:exodeoxyribonuclease VII small subunit